MSHVISMHRRGDPRQTVVCDLCKIILCLRRSVTPTKILSFIVQPFYVGPNINIISTIPNYRTITRCVFESYPSPQIQWIKLSRTVQDPEGRILAADIDTGVNDITTKQIGPTRYESILSVRI